ncbi:MAG TPA: hypothetical protein ENJ35_03540 [Gammaproteobacteria bacterium]|nr:hypothetical protein [Gammaproteobacteria bacterium]
MNRKIKRDPKACLNHQADLLAERHEERLAAMTRRAVAQAKAPRNASLWRPATAAMGLAFTIVVAVTVVLFKPAFEPTAQLATAHQQLIPDWVEDDTVPVSLLENMDLYVWFAHQSAAETQG